MNIFCHDVDKIARINAMAPFKSDVEMDKYKDLATHGTAEELFDFLASKTYPISQGKPTEFLNNSPSDTLLVTSNIAQAIEPFLGETVIMKSANIVSKKGERLDYKMLLVREYPNIGNYIDFERSYMRNRALLEEDKTSYFFNSIEEYKASYYLALRCIRFKAGFEMNQDIFTIRYGCQHVFYSDRVVEALKPFQIKCGMFVNFQDDKLPIYAFYSSKERTTTFEL